MARIRIDIVQSGKLSECLACNLKQNHIVPIKSVHIGSISIDLCKDCREKLSKTVVK